MISLNFCSIKILFFSILVLGVACQASREFRNDPTSAEVTQINTNPQGGEDFRPLRHYKIHPRSTTKFLLKANDIEVSVDFKQFLAEYDFSGPNGAPNTRFGEDNVPFSAFSSDYIHSFGEANLNALTKEQFGALKTKFWPENPMTFNPKKKYSLQFFLPPMYQALMNRRGIFVSMIDCFATAYGLKVDLENPQLIPVQSSENLRKALVKAGAQKLATISEGSGEERYSAVRDRLEFEDIILLDTHATTIISPDLVFEKMNGGTAAFHLTSFSDFSKAWEGSAEIYRLPKGVKLPRLEKFKFVGGGNIPSQEVLADHIQLAKNAQGMFVPTIVKNGGTQFPITQETAFVSVDDLLFLATMNQNGLKFESPQDKTVLFFGRSCDTFSPTLGKGTWSQSSTGFVGTFGNKKLVFETQDIGIKVCGK